MLHSPSYSSTAGALVPDNIIIKMVMDDAVEAADAGQSLLIDGFPRTMEQVGDSYFKRSDLNALLTSHCSGQIFLRSAGCGA